jgi:hypothetical protein
LNRIGEPKLGQILRAAIRNRVADVRTAVPAMIDSYDAGKQTCTVVVAVRLPAADGTPQEVQPLTDVPVKWQRGGGYFCSMPLAKGDPGLLVFSEVDFATWRTSGEVSDAATERRHGLYGYFLPGGCADGDELTDAAADALVIGKDGGPVMRIKPDVIEIGAAAAQFVALANLVKARLDTIQAAFDGHTHAVTVTGSATTQAGTSAAPTGLIGPLADVAATKVKAE